MKNSNLLNRLLSYSHEKQKMGGMRRYAAMLMMLLTLGVGQMEAGNVVYYFSTANSAPLIHYWNNGTGSSWSSRPTMTSDGTKVVNGTTYYLFKYDINTCDKFKIGDGSDLDFEAKAPYTDGSGRYISVTHANAFSSGNMNIDGGFVYFDNSYAGWNDNNILLCIGHATYSTNYTMANVANTDLWYYAGQGKGGTDKGDFSWSDAKYIGMMGSGSPYDGHSWSVWNIKDANHYSDVKHYGFRNNRTYLITKANNVNAGEISVDSDGDHGNNGYGMLNHNQTLHVKLSTNDGASYATDITNGTWRGDITVTSRTYMNGNGSSTTPDDEALSAASSIARSAAITSTFSLTESNTASGYAFKGWSVNNSGAAPTTNSAIFTIDNVRGANDIYAYFAVSPSVSITSVTANTDATPLLGETVTIVASTDNVSGTPTIDYQVKKPGGSWSTVGSNTTGTYVWTPAANDPIGEYEFRTHMTYNTVDYYSGSTITKYIGKMWSLKIKDASSWLSNIHVFSSDATPVCPTAYPGYTLGTYGTKEGQWWILSIYSRYNNFVVNEQGTDQKNQSADMEGWGDGDCYVFNNTWNTTLSSGSCPDVPTVITNTTVSVKNLTSGTMGGNITDDGNDVVSEYGYYYSLNSSLSSANAASVGTKVRVGTDDKDGAFSQSTTGLSVGTTYYFIAYATNPHGTGWGSRQSFTTTLATLSLEGSVNYAAKTMTITPTTNMNSTNGFSGIYYVCCDCTSKPVGAEDPTITWNGTTKKLEISGADDAGNYTFNVKLKAVSNCLGDAFNNADANVTITMKDIPDYSSKTVSQALNSAASGYVYGLGTSASHYKIYQTMSSDHGKVDLTMNYSGVSTAHDAIYYSIGGVETGVMAESESVATATMSLSTSTGSYNPVLKAYAKVDGQTKAAYAATGSSDLYYDVVATPTLGIALKTTSDEAITSTAGLEVGQSIKIVPTLTGGIRHGSYVTYSYRKSGSSDEWTTIATTQATNAAYTWSSNLPTEPNIYTIKATYTDLGVTVSNTQDIVYWKDYTIYVWETGQNLNTANQNITRVHEYYKSNSTDTGAPDRTEHSWTTVGEDALKRTTDLSSTWGGGWCSFNLKWPLYNYFIVGYEAYNDNQYQSTYYYLGTKPEDLYLNCEYHNNSKWSWGASSIEEPKIPSVTITDINIYATKLVVDVAINNNYSLLTAHSITVNNENKDASRTGSVTEVGGGTYRYTLTNLEEDSEYTFRVIATNALGTTTEVKTISTRAKMPIAFTIKVSSNLMANGAEYWGNNGKTSVKVKYWNNKSGIVGTAELSKIAENGGYFWYKYTFEDSPISFYLFNANYSDGSGTNRSANWNDASSNGCAEVYDATDDNSNHKLGQPAKCGIYYKLVYNNGKTSTESNEINDESDKMSLFIGAYNSGSPAGRSLTLKKWANGAWDAGTDIFSTIAPSDSAVYVVSLKDGEDFEDATSAGDWDFNVYDGDYYIRTDHAPGGWNSYLGGGNKMTYSDYSAKLATDPYTHYWMKWVQGDNDAGRKVKFEVANDYNNSLSNGNANFDTDDYTYGSGEGKLKQNANVRFMYNANTNKLSRAYLSGSSSESDYFLVLRGDHASGNHLWKDAEKANEHTTNGTTDWAFFKDENNWVYQVDVYAEPGTRIKLTAQMTNASGVAQQQSFKGDASSASYDAAHTDLLIGGDGTTAYAMRVIYDFKINRLVTAWIPTSLDKDLGINADVMLVREGQGNATQITLNSHKLSDVHTIYAVMQFNRWKLNNRANPENMAVSACAINTGGDTWVYDEATTNTNHPALDPEDDNYLPKSARDIYWISFPFDVNLNNVFGSVGTYGVHWGIEKYYGDERAKKGYWADSEGFWKLLPSTNYTLKAYEGYLLVLDLDYFGYNNTTTWTSNLQQIELYFPSASNAANPIQINTNDVKVEFDQTDYICTIDRRSDADKAAGTVNINKDRRIADSYWHVIGVPSFSNVDHQIIDGDDEDPLQTDDGEENFIDRPAAGSNWQPGNRLYLYVWDPSDNSYSVETSGSSFTFKPMHAYMVQYGGDTLWWRNASEWTNQVPARTRRLADLDLKLELRNVNAVEDHTLMNFSYDEGVTNAFEFNHDLFKEMNGRKGNIWTVTTDGIPVAGNSMPYSENTTIVPVGVKVTAQGDYTFALSEGTNGVGVFLVDYVTGARTNLSLVDYTVNLTAGQYDGRFSLEISPIAQTPTNIENSGDHKNDSIRKMMVDGVLYIVRNGNVFDARGNRVK